MRNQNYQNTIGDWLRYRFHLLVSDAVTALTRPLYSLHCADLLPMWVVDLPCKAIPRSLMMAATHAHTLRWKARHQKGGVQ